METDAKIKELEDEFKVLKAEIRNVLLDIREVILERTNPLADEHETAFIRMDLNTTARAMASEAAAKQMSKAADEAHVAPEEDEPAAGESESEDEETAMPEGVHVVTAEELAEETAEASEETAEPEPVQAADADEATAEADATPAPKVVKRRLPPTNGVDLEPEAPLPTAIPPMYQANMLPLSGTITISEWLTDALSTVGPRELERIIAIHRLWGNMPPNISRALAYLQELLSSGEDESDPPWLKVMQDLDRLAAL
jgi:chemotaxis protein histidine kinase CheA